MFLKVILLLLIHVANAQDGTSADGEVPPKVHQLLQLNLPVEVADSTSAGVKDLLLECIASGNPTPVITWYFLGKVLAQGDGLKYIIKGNRLTVKNVKGQNGNNPHDSGPYRCIATNKFGSVFLEKEIKIRVIGAFSAQNNENKDATQLQPTVNKNFQIECPPHSRKDGYGLTYQWGYIATGESTPRYWRPGNPNPRVYINYVNGDLWYSFVHVDDIKESRDIGGLRCFLVNHRSTVVSNQQVLWVATDTAVGYQEKPDFKVFMQPKMTSPVDSAFSMICGANGNPNPLYSWTYNGIKIKSRTEGSDELNFEFFRFRGKMNQELYITRITQYSGGTFRCYAYNDYGGGSSFKDGQLTVYFPPKWITTFPDMIDLPIGNRLVLYCNASGTPEPKYSWFYNGQVFANDLKRKGIDGVLTIEEAVNTEHDGIYICVAKNELNTLTQSVYIRVKEEAPVFNVPLDDPIYLFKNTKMVIRCDPSGGPKPTKKWQKDQQDIDLTLARYSVTKEGYLEIANVDYSDAGKYTCVAENGIGSPASSTGTAVVLEKTIINRPIQDQTHSRGWAYAVLYCGCEWDERLDLRVEWYKEGIPMAKFDDRIYLEDRAIGPPRLLYFKNLTIQDAGNYSCHAYTKVGNYISEAWAHAMLKIKGPPEPPAAVKITGRCDIPGSEVIINWKKGEELAAETRSFYIEYSTNSSSHLNRWFGGVGDSLIADSRIVATPGTQTAWTITKWLVPGASLIFRIRGASDLMVGRPSRPSEVGSCITQPGPPVLNPLNVTGITRGEGTLIVHWRPLSDVYYGSTGFKYIVGYRKKAETGQTQNTDFTTEEITKNLTYASEFEIPSPGIKQEWEFYVQSSNDRVTVEYLKKNRPAAVSAISGDKKPTNPPRNVRVANVRKFTVELSWDPVPGATSYRIKYWNVTNAEALRGRSKRSVSDPIVYEYQYSNFPNSGILANLTAQVEFMAQVAAVNSGGVSDGESDVVDFKTAARIPGEPSNVHVSVYGKSAHINWQPPINPNGYIEQYEISWQTSRDADVGQDTGRTLITKDRRSREAYLIDQFTPFTYYDLKISARNRVGNGEDWEHILFTVSAPDVPGKPGAPKAKPFDDSAINITFQRPTYGGLPKMFNVYYRPRGDYYQAPKIVGQAFPKRAWILVTGLEFLVYDFWTVGVNDLGQSETSDVTEQQPLRKLKPQAHASTFPWWKSNWFIAVTLCTLFILITMITVIFLLKDGPKTYRRLKDEKHNGVSSSGGGYNNAMPMQTKPQQPPPMQSTAPATSYNGATAAPGAAYMGASAAPDRYDRNTSEVEDHDAPPPDYSSHHSSQSSLQKKEYSGSETGSDTGSETGSDYSGSETGSDYSDEDGSYYSDEEKKRSESEEEDDADAEDTSTFV